MDIELIKNGLKEILNEDISIRNSIADLRRNAFLHSSRAEEKETQVSVKETRIKELSSEIEYFKTQLSIKEKTIGEQLDSVTTEKRSLQETIALKENEISALRKEIARISDQLKSASSATEELSKLSLENSHYASKIRELVAHIEKQQETENKLKGELQSWKLKNKDSESLVKEIESLKSKHASELGALRSEIENLRRSNGKETSSLQKELELLKTQSEETISVLKEEIIQLEELSVETISNLKKELEEKTEVSPALLFEITALQASNTGLQQINTTLQSGNFDLVTENDELKRQVSDLKESSAAAIAVLHAEIETHAAQASLSEETEKLKLELNLRDEEIALRDVCIQDLNAVLVASRETVDARNLEIQELNSQIAEFRAAADRSVESLKAELGQLAGTLIEMSARLAANSKETEALKEIRLVLEKENAELKNTIAQLNTVQAAESLAAETGSAELNELKNENTRMASLTGMLKKRVVELETLNKELKDSLQESGNTSEMQNEFELQVAQLNSEINVHLKAITELEDKAGLLNESLTERTNLLLQAQMEREAYSAELNNLKAQLEKQTNNTIDEEIDNSRLNSLNVLLGEKEEEVLSWKNQWKQLSAEKGELIATINQLKNEAEMKVSDVQTTADEINQEKIKLEETITDLKRELFKAEEKMEEALASSKDSKESEEFIDGLFKKIDILNDKCQKLQAQKEELESQVPELLNKIAELSELTVNQNNAPESLDKNKISPNLAGMLVASVKDKKAAKLKINELVREIDRCIAMLNAQS
jgi:chromosome segregation ATPase